MSMNTIGPGAKVTLHFALKLADGTLIDSNFDGEPAQFEVGDGNLLPGFEKVLMGMAAGEMKTVVIPPVDGFGDVNPANFQQLPLSMFADMGELTPGVVFNFADAAGAERPGIIGEITDDMVKVDFNHPLAGRDITFEVEVLDVHVVSH